MASSSYLKSCCLFLLFTLFSTSPTSSRRSHYLDQLTPSELRLIRSIVRKSYGASVQNLTFHYVGLDDLDKHVVQSWVQNRTTNTPPRRALLAVQFKGRTRELLVHLSRKSVADDKLYTGHSFPIPTDKEQNAADELSLKYGPFLASIENRGRNASEFVLQMFTVGWFGEETSRRVLKVVQFYLNGTINFYMRPIEGTTIVVDLELMKIVEYSDRLRVNLPKASGTDYCLAKLSQPFGPTLNGASIYQPDGPGFDINGHVIR